MFRRLFKRVNYKPLKINEINEIVSKQRVRCAFCCCTQKNKPDTSFKTYQLDVTMYKGKYLLTYEQWVKKIKNK
tara:strand:- start:980 stop:1201 length:222 start_codon:yes stop_codon:yes gene_type:complete